MLTSLYHQKKRTSVYGGFAKTLAMATTDTTGDILSPKSTYVTGTNTALRFNVQRLTVTVLTGAAGKTLTIGDHSGTVTLTPALDMSTAGAEFTFDFGPVGVPLTLGEALKSTISAAGAGAKIVVEGYYSL